MLFSRHSAVIIQICIFAHFAAIQMSSHFRGIKSTGLIAPGTQFILSQQKVSITKKQLPVADRPWQVGAPELTAHRSWLDRLICCTGSCHQARSPYKYSGLKSATVNWRHWVIFFGDGVTMSQDWTQRETGDHQTSSVRFVAAVSYCLLTYRQNRERLATGSQRDYQGRSIEYESGKREQRLITG